MATTMTPEQPNVLSTLTAKLATTGGDHMVLGDFNCTIDEHPVSSTVAIGYHWSGQKLVGNVSPRVTTSKTMKSCQADTLTTALPLRDLQMKSLNVHSTECPTPSVATTLLPTESRVVSQLASLNSTNPMHFQDMSTISLMQNVMHGTGSLTSPTFLMASRFGNSCRTQRHVHSLTTLLTRRTMTTLLHQVMMILLLMTMSLMMMAGTQLAVTTRSDVHLGLHVQSHHKSSSGLTIGPDGPKLRSPSVSVGYDGSSAALTNLQGNLLTQCYYAIGEETWDPSQANMTSFSLHHSRRRSRWRGRSKGTQRLVRSPHPAADGGSWKCQIPTVGQQHGHQ